MSYTSVNPYCSLAELCAEIKQPLEKTDTDANLRDDLLRVIDRASRWVDDYTGLTYYYTDKTVAPIEVNEFSNELQYDASLEASIIFLPYRPIIAITSITYGETEWVDGTDYSIGMGDNDGLIFSLSGKWTPTSPDNLINVYGRFGYTQPSTDVVTVSGDTEEQLDTWQISGCNGRTLYWKLESIAGSLARVRVYLESTFDNLLAQGIGADSGTVTVTLDEQNGSGVSGSVEMTYSQDDTDSANTIIPSAVTVDRTQIPTGIPSRVSTATILVAAAMSGRNRQQVVMGDGSKADIISTTIPKTVYDMLGKRKPLL